LHIYAFGSVCRGDIDRGSDVDLLAIVDGYDDRFDPSIYSIYSYQRIEQLWNEGNPFAWHLSLESRLLHSSDTMDFIRDLGAPRKYENGPADCIKFNQIFQEARSSFLMSDECKVFDLSSMFLGIRNFATCYSLAFMDSADFSRNSANCLGKQSIPVNNKIYEIFENSRLLCTRAIGRPPSKSELTLAQHHFDIVANWMMDLLSRSGVKHV